MVKDTHSLHAASSLLQDLAKLDAIGHDPTYKPPYRVMTLREHVAFNVGWACAHTALFAGTIPLALFLSTRVHHWWRFLPFVPGAPRVEPALLDDAREEEIEVGSVVAHSMLRL